MPVQRGPHRRGHQPETHTPSGLRLQSPLPHTPGFFPTSGLHPTAKKASTQHRNLRASFAYHFLRKSPNAPFSPVPGPLPSLPAFPRLLTMMGKGRRGRLRRH